MCNFKRVCYDHVLYLIVIFLQCNNNISKFLRFMNLIKSKIPGEQTGLYADLGSLGAPASVPTEVSCNKYNCVIGSWLHETRLASRRTRYQNLSKNDYEKL
uniref:Uncharacterized protein n=1 Tax=Trichogramma kaykai TaxID=54128 RepID=A0ABD2X7A8_9HYME